MLVHANLKDVCRAELGSFLLGLEFGGSFQAVVDGLLNAAGEIAAGGFRGASRGTHVSVLTYDTGVNTAR